MRFKQCVTKHVCECSTFRYFVTLLSVTLSKIWGRFIELVVILAKSIQTSIKTFHNQELPTITTGSSWRNRNSWKSVQHWGNLLSKLYREYAWRQRTLKFWTLPFLCFFNKTVSRSRNVGTFFNNPSSHKPTLYLSREFTVWLTALNKFSVRCTRLSGPSKCGYQSLLMICVEVLPSFKTNPGTCWDTNHMTL